MHISAASTSAWTRQTSTFRGGFAGKPAPTQAPPPPSGNPLLAAAKSAASTTGSSETQQGQPDKSAEQAILDTVEHLFGIKIASASLKINASHSEGSASSVQAATSQNAQGSSTDYQAAYAAYEQTTLGVAGTVTTTDGQQFALTLDYQQRIDYQEQTSYQQGGDRQGPSTPGPSFAWAGQGFGAKKDSVLQAPPPPEPPPAANGISWMTKAMKHLKEMLAQQELQQQAQDQKSPVSLTA